MTPFPSAAEDILRAGESRSDQEEGERHIRLLHLVMNCLPSLTNSRGISRNSLAWSIVLVIRVLWVVQAVFWFV